MFEQRRSILTLCLFYIAACTELRLFETRKDEGSVQILVNDVWGNICNNRSTDGLAKTICKTLNYTNGILVHPLTFSTTQYHLDYISCPEGTDHVNNCTLGPVGDFDCNNKHELAVSCGDLVDGGAEIDGVFFRMTGKINDHPVFICWNSTEDVYTVHIDETCQFSNICPSPEAASYQACGCPGVLVEDGRCLSHMCWGHDSDFITATDSDTICDGYYDCINKVDEINCKAEDFAVECVPSENWQSGLIPTDYICDSDTDCISGEDEVHCNHTFGVYCMINSTGGWVDKQNMCDKLNHCDSGEDEKGCDDKTGFFCKSLNAHEMKFIPDYHRCTKPGMTYVDGACEGYIDQMNCSTVDTFECTVKSYQNTRVRKKWICNNNKLCDGGEDEKCVKFNDDCKVHKHQLCDGVNDCQHGEDESDTYCSNMSSDVKCQRLLRGDEERELTIPVSWLCDGFRDCLNGADENHDNWMICGSGDEMKCYPKSHRSCKTGFVCPDKTNTFVPMEYLCDYEESCGGSETAFCKLTKEAEHLLAPVVDREHHRYIAPCLPGLIHDVNFECQDIPHTALTYLAGYHMIHVLKNPQTCRNIFGEQYVLLLCEGLCIENSSCPLTKASYSQCTENIVYMMDDTATVQKVSQSENRFDEHIFVCENRKCLPKSKICNLVDDCGDASDEKGCANSFRCEKGSPKYVKVEQICDGVHDCADSSDECDSCENKQIVDGTFMKCCTLAIGLCSIFVNMYMVRKFVQEKKFFSTRSHFLNLSLVVLISLGDFCVGCYLLNIFIIDQVYNSHYCKQTYVWLTSRHCAFLGVLGTFGTQLSILTMTCLSTYRALNLRNVVGRARVTRPHKMYMIALGSCLIFISLLIGVLPILDWTEDYFTNGMFYKANTLFNKVTNLDVHKNMINLYRRLSNESEKDSYTWNEVRAQLRHHIFTEGYEGVIGESLKFYGNDGVCLFKYFVSPTDPQRIYSLLILFLDLLCFVLISITYGFVILTAHGSNTKTKTIAKTASALQLKRDPQRRNTRLQTKISMMILSNFLCWVPFSIICILHTLSKIDATPYYKISSIVLLPINSCVNPIIYSNIIGDMINWCTGTTSENPNEGSRIDRIRGTFDNSIANNLKGSIRTKFMTNASQLDNIEQVYALADKNDPPADGINIKS